jgi:proline iminopeptidase
MYPKIQPFDTQYLDVGDGHSLYLEQTGTPGGIPVLVLHGGPGAGSSPLLRQFFNPEEYHIIIFDQRGAGQSRPAASIENNTTTHLLEDIEEIRSVLGINRWMVFGGSWGSSLGLLYAQAYPERVLALVLRGIFLCRERDVRWFYQDGASRLFPDYWEDYLAPIPKEEHGDMISAYHQRLTGSDELARMRAAVAWTQWELRSSTLRHNSNDHDTSHALNMARIECHYFHNHSFLRPNQILEDAHLLTDIPGYIVHGRYDAICPVEQAWALNKAWPGSELTIIPAAGHSVTEPDIAKALIYHTDKLIHQLK